MTFPKSATRFLLRARSAVVCASLVAFAGVACAQNAADDALYRQFGGQPGLVTLMDDFMLRLLADPRMSPFFKDVDQKHLKEELVAQFCEVSGGPCTSNGPDMRKAHAGIDVTRTDFNALVEVLQHSMDAQGIAFGAQNRMLAKLAPMHREIVNFPP
ncbi:MAG: group 1 truncated hemoglobin [Rhizobacter sp.]|nr:group 1 truncated hemoglobin [Rhizobacter sp.]